MGFFKAAVSSQDVRQQHFAFLTSGRTTRAWQAQMAAHSWATSKEAAFGAYLDAWRLADFADEVATLPHPKLAILGAHDQAVTRDAFDQTYATLFEDIETVTLSSGHYPIQETPTALAHEVVNFLVKP